MTLETIWSREAFVAALAMSLLHSLWQGAALGGVGFALNARLKRALPEVRYGAFTLLLFTIFAVWLGTFAALYLGQLHPTVSQAGGPMRVIVGHALAASPQTPSATNWLATLSPYLVGAWALGVCGLSLRHLGGFLVLRRLYRTLSTPCSAEWEASAARIAARLGLRRRFRLRCSAQIDVPFAFGLLRPCILLPLGALTGLAPEQIEALIAHELAHLLHHDILFNSLQLCVETILFYHPVVRWLSVQIRVAREQRCDDLAVQVVGDRAVYARALYALEEARVALPQLALGARGDISDMENRHLVGRVRRVLGVTAGEKRDPWAKAALAFGAATVGLIAILPAQAHPQAADTSPVAPATTVTSTTTKTVVVIDGDKIELTGTDLKPDTLVKVNGTEGRFGDLTAKQQEQLEHAVSLARAQMVTIQGFKIGNDAAGTHTAMQIALNINGEKFELTGAELTPDTRIKVNGKESRFGDLSPAEQKQLRETMPAIHIDTQVGDAKKGGKTTMTVNVSHKIRLEINGDTIEFSGDPSEISREKLTSDTALTINGRIEHFGDLSPEMREQIRKALPTVTTDIHGVTIATPGVPTPPATPAVP